MTRFQRAAFAAASAAVCIAGLGACGSTHSVRGKVVSGDIGIVTLVPEQDARLASVEAPAGIPGVTVELRRADAVIASAESGLDGSFTMKLDRSRSGTRYNVVALGPSIFPVRSTSYPPGRGQVMLVVADERRGASSR